MKLLLALLLIGSLASASAGDPKISTFPGHVQPLDGPVMSKPCAGC